MNGSLTLISDTDPRADFAVLIDSKNQIQALAIRAHRDQTDYPLPGAVYNGRVTAILPQFEAVTVDLGQDQSAFVKTGRDLSGGDYLPVMIRDIPKERGKEPLATAEIRLGGQTLVALVDDRVDQKGIHSSRHLERALAVHLKNSLKSDDPPCGIILRSYLNCFGSDKKGALEAVRSELNYMRADIEAIRDPSSNSSNNPGLLLSPPHPLKTLLLDHSDKDIALISAHHPEALSAVEFYIDGKKIKTEQTETPFDHYDIWPQIAGLTTPYLDSDRGFALMIETMQALTAIDIDLKSAPSPEKTVMAAVVEAARQIMLRNISGQIVIDPPRLRGGGEERILQALRTAFKDDRRRTQVFGTTSMGLIEISRKREGFSLIDLKR
mgnify:CR=1 FL=1